MEFVASLLTVVDSACLKISLGKFHLEGLELPASAVHFSISHVLAGFFAPSCDDHVSVPRWKQMPGKLILSSVFCQLILALPGDR